MENVYKVDRSRITYIHGRRNTREELVLGHCENIIGRDYLSDDPLIYEFQAFDSIADAINEQRKQVGEIIARHGEFWKSLQYINRVVVYGHSLSEIDMPYFREVARHVEPETEWYFSLHYTNEIKKEQELQKIESFIEDMGLDSVLCHTFPF